jgi:hypothetical protein
VKLGTIGFRRDALAVGINCHSGPCRPRGVLLADHPSDDRRVACRRGASARSCARAGRTESRARVASRIRLTDVALCARSCARRTVCSGRARIRAGRSDIPVFGGSDAGRTDARSCADCAGSCASARFRACRADSLVCFRSCIRRIGACSRSCADACAGYRRTGSRVRRRDGGPGRGWDARLQRQGRNRTRVSQTGIRRQGPRIGAQ